jgi:sphingomyelin phosphodiesterase
MIYSDPNPRKTYTILHLSDLHVDMQYKEGTLWDCDGYLCCREEWGYPEDPSKAAGKFGGYLCDIPLVTLQTML